MEEIKYPIRINKYLAYKEIASRRGADELIIKRIVTINGKVAKLGDYVRERDDVKITGKIEKDFKYFAYYKPRGLPTSNSSNNEKNVVDIFADEKLAPVGRLDKDSEGLLILTNDWRVTEKLLSPDKESEKEYTVNTRENIREGVVAILEKGMDTKRYGVLKPAQAEITNENTIKIVLHEGKKHQIRIMLSDLKLTVTKLKRTRILNITLKKLRPGEVRQLKGEELTEFLLKLDLK